MANIARKRTNRGVRATILVAEDNERTRTRLRAGLENAGFGVLEARDGVEALSLARRNQIDLIVSDHVMPRLDGIKLLEKVRQESTIPFVFYSSVAPPDVVFQAGRLGALEFLEYPFAIDGDLIPTVRACLTRTPRESQPRSGTARLVGESSAIRVIRQQIKRVARTSAAVLITGETGTGKELVARALHDESGRTPLVSFALPELADGILEAELFGHQKGAFTGAAHTRAGLFERANGGTLFLDEVGEASVGVQTKLLRSLELGEVRRVGGSEAHEVDVRVIAATNANLEALGRQGRFRDDLFYRLSEASIHVPPLRERTDDIEPLSRHFMNELSMDLALPRPDADSSFWETLARQPWRGNARELRAVLRAVLLSWDGTDTLTAAHAAESIALSSSALSPSDRTICQRMLDAYKRHHQVQESARAELGMTRGQWRYRWELYGLEVLSRRRR